MVEATAKDQAAWNQLYQSHLSWVAVERTRRGYAAAPMDLNSALTPAGDLKQQEEQQQQGREQQQPSRSNPNILCAGGARIGRNFMYLHEKVAGLNPHKFEILVSPDHGEHASVTLKAGCAMTAEEANQVNAARIPFLSISSGSALRAA